MIMYQIETVKNKKSKKFIIVIVIIAILLIALAIFAGIQLAKHTTKQEQREPNNINQEENKPQEEQKEIIENSKNNSKLNNEQIQAINQIYTSNEKRVFLTFDDGPSSNITPIILDTLQKENIKATFFVLGTMVKSNPEILKRTYQEGHYIANHGYSHVYKKIYANENKPLEEYHKTNELIQKAIEQPNYQSNVFRFPGGSNGGYYEKVKTKAKKVLEENKVAYLDWNALTNDADGADTETKIMKNLKATCKGKNSVVILMHDAPNKELTAKTLPKVIEYLKEQEYNFKSLYDIL